MKKIVYFLVALLFVPIVANADVAMPDIKTFDVVVIEDSIPYYKSNEVSKEDGTIPKGTKLVVESRFTKDGTQYGQVRYGKNWVWINLEDVIASGELGKDAKYVRKLPTNTRIYVLNEVEVRKGPVASYEKIDTVKDKEFTVEYAFTDDFGEAYYVEYDGKQGWIINSENIFVGRRNHVVIEDLKETSCAHYKRGDFIKNVWVNDDYIAFIKDGEMCKLEGDDKHRVAVLTGKKKHVKVVGEASFINDKKDTVISLSKGEELDVYTDSHRPSVDSDLYYYAELNGERGWLVTAKFDDVEELSSEDYELEEPEPEDPEPKKEKKKHHHDEEPDTNVVLISCVVGAIAFTLGVLVTIVFVNKKKNKVEKPVENNEQK